MSAALPVPPEKAELVVIAAAEIGQLSDALLRSLAADFPPCDPTVLRMRASLLRFSKLAELIDECVAQGDNVPVQQLERDLYGVQRDEPMEADHG